MTRPCGFRPYLSSGSRGCYLRRRMRGLAEFCAGNRKKVLVAWIVIVVVAIGIASGAGASYSSNFNLPSSDSQKALDLLEKRFPAQSGDSIQVVVAVDKGKVTDQAVQAKVQPTLEKIAQNKIVGSVVSPFSKAGAKQVSGGGRIAYATVQLDTKTIDLEKSDVQPIIDTAQSAAGNGLEVELGGQPIQIAEQQQGGGTEAIGLLAAIIVLLITFGSVVAMGLPVITALIALGTGISLLTLSTHVFDIPDFAPQLAAMIGLGVGIDSALFIVPRYRSGLSDGLDVKEAVLQAVDTSGRAVLLAGITVIVALLGMLLLGVTFLYG